MSAALTEPIIADYLRARAAEVAAQLPEMREVRVSVGSFRAGNEVMLSGYIGNDHRLRTFAAATLAAAVEQARAVIDATN